MYKLAFLILFTFTLFACNNPQKETVENQNQDADF